MKYLILVIGMLMSTMAQAEKIIEMNYIECSKLHRDVLREATRMAGMNTRGVGYDYKDIVVVFSCDWINDWDQSKPVRQIYVYSKQEWEIEKSKHEQDMRDRARRVSAERNARLSVLTR